MVTALDEVVLLVHGFAASPADDAASELPNPAMMMGLLVKNFGGLEAFVRAWHEQLQEALKIAPGKKHVLDHFRDMMRLMQEATERQASAVDLNGMTIEEERKYLAELLMAEVAKKTRRVDMLRVCISDEGEAYRQVAAELQSSATGCTTEQPFECPTAASDET